jgi:hypothetical protein
MLGAKVPGKHAVLVAAGLLAAAAILTAQRGGGGMYDIRRPGPNTFQGSFNFCRLALGPAPDGFGGSWGVDYPRADENLSIRLSELTKTAVHMDERGTPEHVVVVATEPELFQCPFIALTNPGRVFIADDEAIALRAYFQKGGFMWSDDFWGSYAWDHWIRELRKVLPEADYRLVDLPIAHVMFHTLYDAKRIPQIPNIGFFGRSGRTSEQGDDSATPHAGAILDAEGRVLVLITHNTDFGDAYEREGDDPTYFYKFSVEGYAIGIDVLLYTLTH